MLDDQRQFADGNPGGPGIPYSRRTSALCNDLRGPGQYLIKALHEVLSVKAFAEALDRVAPKR